MSSSSAPSATTSVPSMHGSIQSQSVLLPAPQSRRSRSISTLDLFLDPAGNHIVSLAPRKPRLPQVAGLWQTEGVALPCWHIITANFAPRRARLSLMQGGGTAHHCASCERNDRKQASGGERSREEGEAGWRLQIARVTTDDAELHR